VRCERASKLGGKGSSRTWVIGEEEGRGTSGKKDEGCTRWKGKECGKGDMWEGPKEGVNLELVGGEVEIEVVRVGWTIILSVSECWTAMTKFIPQLGMMIPVCAPLVRYWIGCEQEAIMEAKSGSG